VSNARHILSQMDHKSRLLIYIQFISLFKDFILLVKPENLNIEIVVKFQCPRFFAKLRLRASFNVLSASPISAHLNYNYILVLHNENYAFSSRLKKNNIHWTNQQSKSCSIRQEKNSAPLMLMPPCVDFLITIKF
jgi:hypothetical protein